MILALAALLFVQSPEAEAVPVDPVRLADTLENDSDMLRGLQEAGDVATIVRPLSVHFEGKGAAIAKLRPDASRLGWFVVSNFVDSGDVVLNLERDQTTDAAAIRRMTEDALRIEAMYGVRYIGWGTEVKAK